ncbi:MAG: hypothetical protein QG644_616 [Patescibacteria group bacterium]|nr:hypothetical protein [Patescibacteria group bacterium]
MAHPQQINAPQTRSGAPGITPGPSKKGTPQGVPFLVSNYFLPAMIVSATFCGTMS